VYQVVEGRRVPILGVYNAAAYSLVPYGPAPRRRAGAPPDDSPPATLKLGTPFVLMRYQLIDLWVLRGMARRGQADARLMAAHQAAAWAAYWAAAAHCDARIVAAAGAPEEAADALCPIAAYIGRREDAEIALKRITLGHGRARCPLPYYPAARKK
jgi:hypothetical protein